MSQGQGEAKPISSKLKIRRGLWSPEEDEKLVNYMMKKNALVGCSWSSVAKQIGLQRCGKSCRMRWINYLRPGLKHGAISPQEEQSIIRLRSIFGNRWSQIAAHVPGRTDNDIKNYWNTCTKRKLKLKQRLLVSSSTEGNANNNTKLNITSQSDHKYKTNSVFTRSHDPCASFHSAKPWGVMPDGHLQSFNNIFNVVATAENQHHSVQEALGLKDEQVQERNIEFVSTDAGPTNNWLISCSPVWIESTSAHPKESCSQVFTSPNLEVQGHAYKTTKSSECHQLIDSWIALPPHEETGSTLPAHETPGSSNTTLGRTVNIPGLVEINDSLKGKIENDVHFINENENEIMMENLSFTASFDFSNVYPNAGYFSSVFPGVESLYPPHNSRSQFRAPEIIWDEVDQYLKIQSQDQDDGKVLANLRFDEVKFGAPTYINIDPQKSSQLPPIGEVMVGDQQQCSAIPANEESKTTEAPGSLGSKTFEF